MTPNHKCGEKCSASAKNGPKIKCCTCDNLCYLQCFDFESGGKIDGQDTVKITLATGAVFTTFLSTMGFSCCTNAMASKDQRKALKMPSSARSSSSSRLKSSENEQIVTNELKAIKAMLTSIKSATDANTAEIAEIKSLSTQTDANVKKVSTQNAAMNIFPAPQSPAMQYVQSYRAKSYAAAARTAATSSSSTETPNAKRKRDEAIFRSKPKFPEPKVGTKSTANGLTIVPKVIREEKPVFAKALYVSGFAPDTSNEQIAQFIVTETSVKDTNKFKVHKMLKKDADISTLKFVSFKVEMDVDELEILEKVELWPRGVRVREFQLIPKNELGRHFPSLPTAAQPPATDTIQPSVNNTALEMDVIDLDMETPPPTS